MHVESLSGSRRDSRIILHIPLILLWSNKQAKGNVLQAAAMEVEDLEGLSGSQDLSIITIINA